MAPEQQDTSQDREKQWYWGGGTDMKETNNNDKNRDTLSLNENILNNDLSDKPQK